MVNNMLKGGGKQKNGNNINKHVMQQGEKKESATSNVKASKVTQKTAAVNRTSFKTTATPINLAACSSCKPVLNPTPVEGKNRILNRWIRGPNGEPYFGNREIFLPGFNTQQFIYELLDCIFVLNFVEPGYPSFTILSIYYNNNTIIESIKNIFDVPQNQSKDTLSADNVYEELAINVLTSAKCNMRCSTDVLEEQQKQTTLIEKAKLKTYKYSFFLHGKNGPIRLIEQILDKNGKILLSKDNTMRLYLIEPTATLGGTRRNNRRKTTKRRRKTNKKRKPNKRRKTNKSRRRR